MKQIILALTLVLGMTSLAHAQVNDCDTRSGPITASMTAGSYTFSTCWEAKDLDGNVIPVGQETWFKVDNGADVQLPAPTRSATPSPIKGSYLFSWTIVLTKTNVVHVYNTRVCIPDGIGGTVCAIGTDPFTATNVRGKGPNAPHGGRIQ